MITILSTNVLIREEGVKNNMARIGIYSDVHISHSSSILPTYINDDMYTTRLNMCKNSIKWAYEQFNREGVDVVVNCGDTFNSHTLAADELCAYNDIIRNIYKPYDVSNLVPDLDITIVGNHDKYNQLFNSLNMLNLTDYSTLVDNYLYFDIDNYDCYCIAFYDSNEFVEKVLEMLNKYPKQHDKSILFMHGDINGSMLSGNKRIENHIGTDFLTLYFDIVINGHIHCHELIYQQNNKRIYNIGSLTSHSFADSNNHVPACWILDTETEMIEQINNPHAILFKTEIINDENDIITLIRSLKFISNKMILKIKCPIDLKGSIKTALESLPNVVKVKYIFSYDTSLKNDSDKNNNISNSTESDIRDDFIRFLSTRTDLKGNINDYKHIIPKDVL